MINRSIGRIDLLQNGAVIPWSRRKYTTGAKDRIVGFVPIHANPVPSARDTPVPNAKGKAYSSPQTRTSVVTSVRIDSEGTRLGITANFESVCN